MGTLRLFAFLVVVAGLAFGLSKVADQPGKITFDWLGYQAETNVLVAAVVLLALVVVVLFVWSLLRYLVTRPSAVRRGLRSRKERRGRDAVSQGLVAIGAGDRQRAQKFAAVARKSLPNEPLTLLLSGQSAQMSGDRAAARRIFETMTDSPETELFGLHGLFLEAQRENAPEAARQFAERAMRRNPKLAWSVNALFELQCKARDWSGALKTLRIARDHKQIDRDVASRRCAVLLTAQAQEAEETDPDRARDLALEAHKLAPDLIPAAEIAGRILASQGSASRASRVVTKTWRLSPHPALAAVHAHARPGDAPRDRLKRVRTLAETTPDSVEGPIAVATEAIEGRDWKAARKALEPLLEDRPTARICTLMARIEGGESGDAGRVREWLARAVRAPRDPAWTADGVVSDHWAPVSPVTGALDVFEWRVPLDVLGPDEEALVIEGLAAEDKPALISAEAPAAPGLPASESAAAGKRAGGAESPPPPEPDAPEADATERSAAADGADAAPPTQDETEPTKRGPDAEAEFVAHEHQPDDPGTRPVELEDKPGADEGERAARH